MLVLVSFPWVSQIATFWLTFRICISITVFLVHDKSYSFLKLEARPRVPKLVLLSSLWDTQCLSVGFCIVVCTLPLDSFHKFAKLTVFDIIYTTHNIHIHA